MQKNLIESRFLDAKAKGDTSGDWVAQPKYKFNIVPNAMQTNDTILQVWAKLNMDFLNGGEIEYICELIYRFINFNTKTQYNLLIDTASNCNLDLEHLFDKEKIVNRTTPDLVIWARPDPDQIKNLVNGML